MILKNWAEDFLQEFSFPISVAGLMENLDLNITQSHTLIAIIIKFLTLHVGPLCQESTKLLLFLTPLNKQHFMHGF